MLPSPSIMIPLMPLLPVLTSSLPRTSLSYPGDTPNVSSFPPAASRHRRTAMVIPVGKVGGVHAEVSEDRGSIHQL